MNKLEGGGTLGIMDSQNEGGEVSPGICFMNLLEHHCYRGV